MTAMTPTAISETPLADRLSEPRDAAAGWLAVATAATWAKRLMLLAALGLLIAGSSLYAVPPTAASSWRTVVTGLLGPRPLAALAFAYALVAVAGVVSTAALLRRSGGGPIASALLGLLTLADLFGAALPVMLAFRQHGHVGDMRRRVMRGRVRSEFEPPAS